MTALEIRDVDMHEMHQSSYQCPNGLIQDSSLDVFDHNHSQSLCEPVNCFHGEADTEWFFFVVLGIQPSALCVLDMCVIAELPGSSMISLKQILIIWLIFFPAVLGIEPEASHTSPTPRPHSDLSEQQKINGAISVLQSSLRMFLCAILGFLFSFILFPLTIYLVWICHILWGKLSKRWEFHKAKYWCQDGVQIKGAASKVAGRGGGHTCPHFSRPWGGGWRHEVLFSVWFVAGYVNENEQWKLLPIKQT